MRPIVAVSGVLGLCRVDFPWSTHAHAAIFAGWEQSVLGVSGLLSRTRMRTLFGGLIWHTFFSHAKSKNPNKPNPLATFRSNLLNLLSFICVGFVLGWAYLCWVATGGCWG